MTSQWERYEVAIPINIKNNMNNEQIATEII